MLKMRSKTSPILVTTSLVTHNQKIQQNKAGQNPPLWSKFYSQRYHKSMDNARIIHLVIVTTLESLGKWAQQLLFYILKLQSRMMYIKQAVETKMKKNVYTTDESFFSELQRQCKILKTGINLQVLNSRNLYTAKYTVV